MELQAGTAIFRHTVKNRSRLTLLGLSVKYAWRELKNECPGFQPGELVVRSMALEATLGFIAGKKDVALADVVRIFKRLIQDRYVQSTGMPCDLWAPGFIEMPMKRL